MRSFEKFGSRCLMHQHENSARHGTCGYRLSPFLERTCFSYTLKCIESPKCTEIILKQKLCSLLSHYILPYVGFILSFLCSPLFGHMCQKPPDPNGSPSKKGSQLDIHPLKDPIKTQAPQAFKISKKLCHGTTCACRLRRGC